MRLPRKIAEIVQSQAICVTAAVMLAVASVVMVVSTFEDDQHWFQLGALLLVLAMGGLIWRRSGVTARAIEKIRQAGYDDGYADGRSTRASLIALPGPAARDRSAKQLSQ